MFKVVVIKINVFRFSFVKNEHSFKKTAFFLKALFLDLTAMNVAKTVTILHSRRCRRPKQHVYSGSSQ